MVNPFGELEVTTAQDRFFDFCLWEYNPIVPCDGKLRSVNLLWHSFKALGVDQALFPLVQAIRHGLGHARTVWGVKQFEDHTSWEFYFYDYRRRARTRSIGRIKDIIDPFITCDVNINENLQYFMFSIDIDRDLINVRKNIDEIHVYVGNPGSTVSSGICYCVKNDRTRLENFYFFFDARKQRQAILDKIDCSVHFDGTRIAVDQILWPELKQCKVIVVANKQESDAVYFSGINIDQLIFFLNRMNYNRQIVTFIEAHRSKLDHLQYDIGFDYRIEGGCLRILKSAYYGVF